eukprot:3296956-Amphidinium_carterae.1
MGVWVLGGRRLTCCWGAHGAGHSSGIGYILPKWLAGEAWESAAEDEAQACSSVTLHPCGPVEIAIIARGGACAMGRGDLPHFDRSLPW